MGNMRSVSAYRQNDLCRKWIHGWLGLLSRHLRVSRHPNHNLWCGSDAYVVNLLHTHWAKVGCPNGSFVGHWKVPKSLVTTSKNSWPPDLHSQGSVCLLQRWWFVVHTSFELPKAVERQIACHLGSGEQENRIILPQRLTISYYGPWYVGGKIPYRNERRNAEDLLVYRSLNV